ncbi:MAG: single-stranded DNA-binding protein, partial [Gammaproteobacteria bacterium]|nr:single-stranded DNA-binding protein [Gammaproteobacteria bacterium]
LQTRQWEKEGQKHYTTEIIAREMQMLDSRGGVGGDMPSTEGGESASSPSQDFGPPPADDFDDDIPF